MARSDRLALPEDPDSEPPGGRGAQGRPIAEGIKPAGKGQSRAGRRYIRQERHVFPG